MEQEIDIKIAAAIDAVDASKTLGELRKSIKDLKSLALEAEEGSKEFDTLTSKIGQANDRLKDLNEVVAMKTGNNIENLAKSFAKIGSYGATSLQTVTGAMGLFGDQSEETMKQLVKLQAAFNFANGIKALVEGFDEVKKSFSVLMTTMKSMMASNPFGLILIAITAVIGALFLLRNHIKPIGDLFNNIGKVIKNIIQLIKDFSDWLGISNFALDESTKKTIDSAEKQKKAIQDRYELERKEAEKTKKSIALLTYEKEKADNQETERQIRAYRKKIIANGELRDEEKKHYDELEKMNHEYYQNLLKSVDDYISENISKNKQMELELINIKLEADPNNKALLQAKYDAEISLLEDNKEKEIQIIRDARETAKKQNEEAYKDGKKKEKEYREDLEEINKTSNDLITKVRETYNQEEINKTKTKNKTILDNEQETADKIKEIRRNTYETNLENLEYNADKSEKLYNDEYNKITDILKKEYQAYLNNGKLINDNDINTAVVKNIRLEAVKNQAIENITDLYNETKKGHEDEIKQLEKQNSKIKDKNSARYVFNEAQIKKLQNTIEQLTINHNERIKTITDNNDKILIDAKNKAYDEQIKIEEEVLNRTDVIYNLKLQKLEDNLKYEQDVLKKSLDEGEILQIQYYMREKILKEQFNLDKVKLELETLKKIENGRELSNNLQIRSQAKQWNKLNNLLKAFLNVDQKEYDAALLNNLNELEKQKNNEQKVLEDYYNTQKELHKDNTEELKKIDEQYAKDKAQIDADYEKKKQDETEAAHQAYMQQVTNNLGQYFSALSSLFSNISSLVDQMSEQQIATAEEVMNKQIEAIDATTNAQIAAAERDITDTVALEEAKKNITNNAVAQTLAAKNKYADEENKLKRKQFKVEKASNITKATMDGIMAVMQALASAPPPYNAILAAISGAAAAVNIGMLASIKPPKELEGADVSGGSFTSPYTGGSGSSGSSSSPNVNAAAFYKLGQGGPNVLSNQSGMDNKVYVVESDIRNTTGRVETIERRASRGL